MSDRELGPDRDEASERIFDGRYRIEGRAGEGGMGVVLRAWDLRHDRPVAIKILGAFRRDDEALCTRFLREARAMARLEHPNVLRIFDVGRDEAAGPYFVMDYVADATLEEVLEEGGGEGLPRELCLGVAGDLASALEAVHERGIVHRDLKPANVFVSAEGGARLCDFGVARLFDATTLTETGTGLGTPAYMAPELLDGKEALPAADVFQFGLLLYEMLTGRPLFASVGERLARHGLPLTVGLSPEEEGRIPPGLRSILLRCLRVNPTQRFPSGRELRESLDEGGNVPLPQDVTARATTPELVPPELVPPARVPPAPSIEGSAAPSLPSGRSRVPVVLGMLLSLGLAMAFLFPRLRPGKLALETFRIEAGIRCLRITVESNLPAEARIEVTQGTETQRELSASSLRRHVFVLRGLRPDVKCDVALRIATGRASLEEGRAGLRVQDAPGLRALAMSCRRGQAILDMEVESGVAVAAAVVQCDEESRSVPCRLVGRRVSMVAGDLDPGRSWAYRFSFFRRPWERWSLGPIPIPSSTLASPGPSRWGLYFAFPSLDPRFRNRPFNAAALDRFVDLGIRRVLLACGRHLNWSLESVSPVIRSLSARGIRVDLCLCYRRTPKAEGAEMEKLRRFFALHGKALDRVVLGYTPDTDGWLEGPEAYARWWDRAHELVNSVQPRLSVEGGMLFSLANTEFFASVLAAEPEAVNEGFSLLHWSTSFRGAATVDARMAQWQAIARKGVHGVLPWTVFLAYPSRVQNLNDAPLALLFDLRVEANDAAAQQAKTKEVIEIGQTLGYSGLEAMQALEVYGRDSLRAWHGGARSIYWTLRHDRYGQLQDAGLPELDSRLWAMLARCERLLEGSTGRKTKSSGDALALFGLRQKGGRDGEGEFLVFDGGGGPFLGLWPKELGRTVVLSRPAGPALLPCIPLGRGELGESLIRLRPIDGVGKTVTLDGPCLILPPTGE